MLYSLSSETYNENYQLRAYCEDAFIIMEETGDEPVLSSLPVEIGPNPPQYKRFIFKRNINGIVWYCGAGK